MIFSENRHPLFAIMRYFRRLAERSTSAFKPMNA
jgi:hypothetical protein